MRFTSTFTSFSQSDLTVMMIVYSGIYMHHGAILYRTLKKLQNQIKFDDLDCQN